MRTSIFAFASDLQDEGMNVVLDNVQNRGGLGGVTLASVYHDARDIFPHNPRSKVRFLESGAAFFRPDLELWRGSLIQPRVSELAAESDPLDELVAAAGRRQLDTHAWTVFLHNDHLGTENPGAAPSNVYGDPDLTGLCPANPDVRTYATLLSRDIGGRGVASIVAESLHYHPLEHGFAHERYPAELGSVGRFLLGLCFCQYCLTRADADDVDVEAVRHHVRQQLDRVFESRPESADGVDRATIDAIGEGELGRYLAVRERTVSSLAAEVASAAAPTPVSFIDPSGAARGHAPGLPSEAPTASSAWRYAIDLAAVGAACGRVCALGYAADPERLRLDLDAYLRHLPAHTLLSVGLRPAEPDCYTIANMAEKLRLLHELDVDVAHFYHYGLIRLEALDLIRAALTTASLSPGDSS